MSTSVAAALLDQLRASFPVHIAESRSHDDEGRDLTAISETGERWIARAEDDYAAARAGGVDGV